MSVQTVGGKEHPLVIPTQVRVVLGHVRRDVESPGVEVTLLGKLAVIQITGSHSRDKRIDSVTIPTPSRIRFYTPDRDKVVPCQQ